MEHLKAENAPWLLNCMFHKIMLIEWLLMVSGSRSLILELSRSRYSILFHWHFYSGLLKGSQVTLSDKFTREHTQVSRVAHKISQVLDTLFTRMYVPSILGLQAHRRYAKGKINALIFYIVNASQENRNFPSTTKQSSQFFSPCRFRCFWWRGKVAHQLAPLHWNQTIVTTKPSGW